LDSFSDRDRLDSFIYRDRLDSLANLSGIFSRGRDRLDSLASLGEASLTMSIGDLEDVAGKLEQVVSRSGKDGGDDTNISDSDLSIGQDKPKVKQEPFTTTNNHLPPPTIQVDSEAVQAAVQAAMAATAGGVLDFLNISNVPEVKTSSTKEASTNEKTSNVNIIGQGPTDDMEAIRARARAAAGYIHPQKGSSSSSSSKQSNSVNNKRPLINAPVPPSKRQATPQIYGTPKATERYVKAPSGALIYSNFNSVTPKRQNFSSAAKSIHTTPGSSLSKGGGQSNQKWDEMFECLVSYVKEERLKATKDMSEEDKTKWEWSGNVPTMFKTKDKKALGRWINNQRSAKSKGTLKMEREMKLMSTGLKWSVLTTNAWTDMMKELKLYVNEKTKEGKMWDGNVPTNYKIKTVGETSEADDDKNLGRWINRQRSLYQSGKLKEERRNELEKIGLKWAVLSTTSWQAMYEALCTYAKARRSIDKNNKWDGNVPPNYETNEKPPKRLGRWVTRQRTQYASKKLKDDCIEKLEKIGLTWEIAEKPLNQPYPRSLPAIVGQRPTTIQTSGSRIVVQGKTTTGVTRSIQQTTVVRQVQVNPSATSQSTLKKTNNTPPVATFKSNAPPVATLKSNAPPVVTFKSNAPPVVKLKQIAPPVATLKMKSTAPPVVTLNTMKPKQIAPPVATFKPKQIAPPVVTFKSKQIAPPVATIKPKQIAPPVATFKPKQIAPPVVTFKSKQIAPPVATIKPKQIAPPVATFKPKQIAPPVAKLTSITPPVATLKSTSTILSIPPVATLKSKPPVVSVKSIDPTLVNKSSNVVNNK